VTSCSELSQSPATGARFTVCILSNKTMAQEMQRFSSHIIPAILFADNLFSRDTSFRVAISQEKSAFAF